MITTYCSPETPGAFCFWPSPTPYCRKERTSINGFVSPPSDDPCLRTFGVGTTVRVWERNGYDDSDFYATYYDHEAKEFKTVEYASTRGWTYTASANVDATPEIVALYSAHCRKTERNAKARFLRFTRNEDRQIGARCGIPTYHVRLIRDILGERADAVFTLLKTKNFRSGFRASLAAQVRKWLAGNRQYSTPLSPKQLNFLN